MPAEPRPPIALIGYRGVGKSAVAGLLAARLGYEVVDSDELIEQQAGKTIAEIFAEEDETGFRTREASVVQSVCQREAAVLALGGGAVLSPANRLALANCQAVVWLTASVDALCRRIGGDQSTASRRPNLTNTGGRSEIEALLAERTPIYQQCATLVVDTENKNPAEIAAEIAQWLEHPT